MKPSCPQGEFIELVQKFGVYEAARKLGLDKAAVFKRRARIEKNSGTVIRTPPHRNATRNHIPTKKSMIKLGVENGTVIIGSDAHYWPNIITTAHRAFVKFCDVLKPKIIIKNGD